MLESVLVFLIYVCFIAIAIWLILWVLQTVIGITLPAKVVQIGWVIFLLVVLLLFVRMVLPALGVSL